MWMMWRRGPKTPGFALLLTLFATLHVATSADAASLGRQCRQVCRDEIAACVAAEGHSRACRRSTLQRCRQEGVAVCQGQAGQSSSALAGACSSPTVIPAQGGTFSGTTSGTSSLAGSCGSSANSPERVFQWTPTVSGTATIQTCGAGTNFDTVLYMRSGVCASGPEVVSGCNDDTCPNSSGLFRASRIMPTVTAGQTYFIVVDGYGGAQGTFSLTVTAPGASTTTTLRAVTSTTTTTLPGACSSPTVISAAGGTFSGTTSGTSSQAGSCGSSGSSPERVFRWTPTVSGTATIQTCGAATNFDTILYMRSGVCSGGAEVVSGCNDDACANSSGLSRASRITPTVTAGQTYFIVVDGYGGSHGTFSLTVTPPGASATTTTLRAVTASTTSTTVTTRPPTTTTSLRDTVAPSVPTALSASAPSCSQINLGWNPSTDSGGSGLKGYNVYRNSVFVKQVLAPGTTTSDPGMAASTVYTYNVAAIDNAGNTSGMSVAASTNTPACVAGGQFIWNRQIGGSGVFDAAHAMAVATDPSGNVVVAGSFEGTVNFGTGPMTSSGFKDVFVAKYSAAGVPLWAKSYGEPNDDEEALGVAMDGSGGVVVTGYFKQTVNFGTGPLTAAGTYLGDVFVAKYSASGAPLWVKQVGSSGFDKGTAIAVDGASNVLVTGYFNGTVNFGLGTVTSAGGPDVFLVKYTPEGAPLWAKRFGGSGFDVAHGIGVDGGGNVAVTGEFQNTADFGTGLLTSAGGRDIFLAEYSPDGAPLWSRSFGGTSEDGATSVALDGSGNVIVTGSFTGAVDFGGGLLPDLGGGDIFLAKYSPSGAHLWSKRFGGGGSLGEQAAGVTADGAGNVILTGAILDSVSFGGPVLWSNQTYDIYVAKFTAAGAYLWSRRAGEGYDDSGLAVAADGSGNALVAGYFSVAADLGGGRLTSPGGTDGFVVKYAP